VKDTGYRAGTGSDIVASTGILGQVFLDSPPGNLADYLV